MKKRVARYMLGADCPECHGKRLRRESLSVTFAGLDIAELSRLPLKRLAALVAPFAGAAKDSDTSHEEAPEKTIIIHRITRDLATRLDVLLDLGLGYLSLDRSTPTLSPGELQRLRLATQVHSNLFGVVYVLDEPSAGLHPADTEALLRALRRLKDSGNSLFVVENELDVVRAADWIVDVGPGPGDQGGLVLYSGPPEGLRQVAISRTGQHLFRDAPVDRQPPRTPAGWLKLRGITRNNLKGLDVDIPLGVLASVTGVSGSGKSTLVSQFLVEAVAERLGHALPAGEEGDTPGDALHDAPVATMAGEIVNEPGDGFDRIARLVVVDQKPIGRPPRSNLATYTGLFDHVRRLFAASPQAKARRYDAGRFSFNVAKGRCPKCEGEGFVFVELLFLPSVYAPCPACHGARYNEKTLEIKLGNQSIADVLNMTVEAAHDFFHGEAALSHSLETLRNVGLGYLRLGQPATELSGGEAQRIKLATELQRSQRGRTLYILDEPTTGLHPVDVERLVLQLQSLVAAGNSVVVVEHDMGVVAGSDWVIDIGPGAGEDGGRVVAAGVPEAIARAAESVTGRHLAKEIAD